MPNLTTPRSHESIESDDEVPQLPSLCPSRPGPASPTYLEIGIDCDKIKKQSYPVLLHSANIYLPQRNLGLSPYPNHVSSSETCPSSSKIETTATLEQDGPVTVTDEVINNRNSFTHIKPKLLPKLPEVNCVVRARIPTTIGGSGTEMFLHLYQNSEDSKEHLAIVFGNKIRSRSLDRVRIGETEMDRLIRGAYVGRLYPGRTNSDLPCEIPISNKQDDDQEAPLVRIHSECYTGETVWSARCDCGEQLDEAARLMSTPSPMNTQVSGVIIYLRQEGRGIGLGEKLKAYNLQDLGSDTVEANLLLRHPVDARSYGLATAMLVDLNIRNVRLLTNNPEKIRAIEGPNREIYVTERLPMIPLAWRKGETGGIRSQEVGGYLQTKIKKMGHMLSMDETM